MIELHKRYASMYIPSDFFMANFKWQDVFPIHRPMTVAQPCAFHIMHKEAPPPQGAATVIDPPDANYAFCAKVSMLWTHAAVIKSNNNDNDNNRNL